MIRRLAAATHALFAQNAPIAMSRAVPAITVFTLSDDRNVLLLEQAVGTNASVAVEDTICEQSLPRFDATCVT